MRAQRFFRALWRINALLIAVASAGIAIVMMMVGGYMLQDKARQREAAAAAVNPGKPSNKELTLGGLTPIEGTSLFRATLSSPYRGLDVGSSGGGAPDTRNMLFIDTATGTATWLLAGDREVIANSSEIVDETKTGERKPPLGMVALVKPYGADADGRLLMLEMASLRSKEFAAGVHALDGVTITPAGDVAVLFQKNRQYYLALFDKTTLTKKSEREIAVPALR